MDVRVDLINVGMCVCGGGWLVVANIVKNDSFGLFCLLSILLSVGSIPGGSDIPSFKRTAS